MPMRRQSARGGTKRGVVAGKWHIGRRFGERDVEEKKTGMQKQSSKRDAETGLPGGRMKGNFQKGRQRLKKEEQK